MSASPSSPPPSYWQSSSSRGDPPPYESVTVPPETEHPANVTCSTQPQSIKPCPGQQVPDSSYSGESSTPRPPAEESRLSIVQQPAVNVLVVLLIIIHEIYNISLVPIYGS